jgi:purine-binding chemotaxis protein CheW
MKRGAPSPDDVTAVLAARARALAAPPPRAPAGELIELLTFAVAGARYGLPTSQVEAVARLAAVTRVPGVGPAVAGVTNHEGNVLLVVELPTLLGLDRPPTRSDAARYLLVVHDPSAKAPGGGPSAAEPLGLIADELHDIRVVEVGALHPLGDGAGGPRLGRAQTSDGCLVLDAQRLLTEPSLTNAAR